MPAGKEAAILTFDPTHWIARKRCDLVSEFSQYLRSAGMLDHEVWPRVVRRNDRHRNAEQINLFKSTDELNSPARALRLRRQWDVGA
jgi:hypothetical protein